MGTSNNLGTLTSFLAASTQTASSSVTGLLLGAPSTQTASGSLSTRTSTDGLGAPVDDQALDALAVLSKVVG